MPSTKRTSNNVRRNVIRLCCELEKKPSDVARDFNIKANTVRKIVREYRTTCQVEAKGRGGARSSQKITPEIASCIKSLVENDCTLTLLELQAKVLQIYELSVSTSSISR